VPVPFGSCRGSAIDPVLRFVDVTFVLEFSSFCYGRDEAHTNGSRRHDSGDGDGSESAKSGAMQVQKRLIIMNMDILWCVGQAL
jgi:hypothetical protein